MALFAPLTFRAVITIDPAMTGFGGFLPQSEGFMYSCGGCGASRSHIGYQAVAKLQLSVLDLLVNGGYHGLSQEMEGCTICH